MSIAIIGCGNSNRSDDGVGSYVIRQLQALPGARSDIAFFDTGTNGMEVMFKARGCRELIVIDACESQSPPGTLFEVPGDELQAIPDPGLNLHDFRWQNALYAGQRIFKEQFPKELTVYLIEAQTLKLGLTLSDPVRRTADELVTRLTQRYLLIDRRLAQ